MGTQRCPVAAERSGANRLTNIAVPDLPPPLPAVGGGRQVGAHLASAGRGVAGSRETATEGGIY
jgi:hypothetical protein